jgi:hypothetical protein
VTQLETKSKKNLHYDEYPTQARLTAVNGGA